MTGYLRGKYPSVQDIDASIEECKRFVNEFRVGSSLYYIDQLQSIANRERVLFEIDLEHVHEHSENLNLQIRANCSRYIKFFEQICDNVMPQPSIDIQDTRDIVDILRESRENEIDIARRNDQAIDEDKAKLPAKYTRRYDVIFLVPTNEPAKKLREIHAVDIGHIVKIKGMVTRSTDVKPHITVSTYVCEVCNSEIYYEINGPSFMPKIKCESEICKENKNINRLRQIDRGCKFIKYQELRLQELPDQVPVGHIPRSMTVKCRGELTRQCGPGDIVTISGIFSTVKVSGFKAMKSGLKTDTFVEAMLIEKQKQGYNELELDLETEALVRSIGNDPDPYGRLAKSIAPEIYGHEDVKKALLLQLVSGVTKVLPDGMKIRGDINICLMGDPGVAKSQLLKHISSIAPRGVYTTGKGSSGVGLTAAVIRDTLTGDLTLEGGALVLADMGICCIDEFDKMDESDRTAIHEVMEQQTISIAKAGITTTLNARAAVLAAANPLYGRYNKRKSISDNVDLPNSLLSRFDLLFLILDKADIELDLALSRHVLHVHKYKRNPEQIFKPIPPNAIKQYIAAARTINPSVPVNLGSYITEAYVDLRARDAAGSAPGSSSRHTNDQNTMTARQLLSILRLGQALARLRLSNEISSQDIDEAIRLTHASKASLLDDTKQGQQREDPISSIFNLIRDHTQVRNVTKVRYNDVEKMVLNAGFTSNQLKTTIQEYSNLGILNIDDDNTTITIHDTN